jgi:hypothetical protein
VRLLQDGKVIEAYGSQTHNIRLMLSAEPEQLRCIDDQGAVITLTPAHGPTAAGAWAPGEGQGEPAEGSTAAAQPAAGEQQEEPGTAGTLNAAVPGPSGSSAAVGPEYLAETGYRGVR